LIWWSRATYLLLESLLSISGKSSVYFWKEFCKKAKPPVARFFISLPLADNERLSEDFVRENYAEWRAKSNADSYRHTNN